MYGPAFVGRNGTSRNNVYGKCEASDLQYNAMFKFSSMFRLVSYNTHAAKTHIPRSQRNAHTSRLHPMPRFHRTPNRVSARALMIASRSRAMDEVAATVGRVNAAATAVDFLADPSTVAADVVADLARLHATSTVMLLKQDPPPRLLPFLLVPGVVDVVLRCKLHVSALYVAALRDKCALEPWLQLAQACELSRDDNGATVLRVLGGVFEHLHVPGVRKWVLRLTPLRCSEQHMAAAAEFLSSLVPKLCTSDDFQVVAAVCKILMPGDVYVKVDEQHQQSLTELAVRLLALGDAPAPTGLAWVSALHDMWAAVGLWTVVMGEHVFEHGLLRVLNHAPYAAGSNFFTLMSKIVRCPLKADHVLCLCELYPNVADFLLRRSSTSLTVMSILDTVVRASFNNCQLFIGKGILHTIHTALRGQRATETHLCDAISVLAGVVRYDSGFNHLVRAMGLPMTALHVLMTRVKDEDCRATVASHIVGILVTLAQDNCYPVVYPLSDDHVQMLCLADDRKVIMKLFVEYGADINVCYALQEVQTRDACVVCMNASDEPFVRMPCCGRTPAHVVCARTWHKTSSRCLHCNECVYEALQELDAL
jgi:hypothetical protein